MKLTRERLEKLTSNPREAQAILKAMNLTHEHIKLLGMMTGPLHVVQGEFKARATDADRELVAKIRETVEQLDALLRNLIS